MGYPQPPAAPSRPGTVTAAAYAMFAVAVVQLAGIPLALASIGPTQDAFRKTLGPGDQTDAAVTVSGAVVYIGVAVAVLFAAGWIVLGLLDLRGKQVARIITWVVCGLFMCCLSFSVLGLAGGGGFGRGGTVNGVSQADLTRAVNDALPSYYRPLNAVSLILNGLLVLGVIILLALPASNEFFRPRPADTWEPPVPGMPYPPA
jgi:hypothetical protein